MKEFKNLHMEAFSKAIGSHFKYCTDCSKVLKDDYAKSIGLGSSCQKRHIINYTIIPEFQECETILDELATELDLEMIIILNRDDERSEKWMIQNESPPYDWRDINETDLSEIEKLRKYSINLHKYVPHNLYEGKDVGEWNMLVMLNPSSSLFMKRHEATPGYFEDRNEYLKVHWTDQDTRYLGDKHDKLDIRKLSVKDMLYGDGNYSPPEYPSTRDAKEMGWHSSFQEAFAEHYQSCNEGWEWEGYINEIGWLNPEDDDLNHLFPSEDIEKYRYDLKDWEEVFEQYIEIHGHLSDDLIMPTQISNNMRNDTLENKHMNRLGFFQLDWISWLFPVCSAYYYYYACYDAAGKVVHVIDTWKQVVDHDLWMIEEYSFGHYWYSEQMFTDNSDLYKKLILGCLSNLQMTKPLTT